MKLKAFCICAALLLSILLPAQILPSFAAEPSAGEAVLEVESGRLLYAKNEREQMPMASTTKIMTALLVIEECSLDDVVTIPAQAAGVEGSSIYLQEGEKMTVRDLLYGLMLRSGNDCAVALALHHSNTLDAFCKRMNERANELGAFDTHFSNPHGLPAKGHFTTAHDLAVIAAYALKNPVFSQIVSAHTYTIPDGGCGYARFLQNKNKMLCQYEGADGVKTGYTKEAGRCLVSSATRDGMRIVCVVLDSPDMYNRSGELLDKCFSEYKLYKLFDSNEYIVELDTDVSEKTCKCRAENDFVYPLRKEELAFVRIEEDLPERLVLPVQEGDVAGNLKIYLKNQLIFSQKIVSIERKEKSFLDILREIGKRNGLVCGSTNFLQNAALQAGAPATN